MLLFSFGIEVLVEEGDLANQPNKRNGRRVARPYANWGTDTKLVVKTNRFGQPIGKNASKLASQLGIIARNGTFFPLNYTDWRCEELDSKKERIWEDVKSNCEVSDDYKDICLKSVGNKWRNWKSKLKKEHYLKYDNDEERIQNVPDRVKPEQWKDFVLYNGTDEAKERSEANQTNQKGKVMSHTTGRKSHAALRDEMTVDGIEPDRIDFYFVSHTRKENGQPVDEVAAGAIAAIKGKLDTVSEDEQTPVFREKVFTDVLGCDKHGRVRTYGTGVCPTKLFGKKDNICHEKYSIDMEKLRNDVREEVREEVSKEFAGRFEHIERKYAKFEELMKNMGRQVPSSPDGQSTGDQEVSEA